MGKRSKIVCIFICVWIALLLGGLLIQCRDYLYPSFSFDVKCFALNAFAIIVAEAFVVFCIYLCKRGKAEKIIVGSLATLLMAYCLVILMGVSSDAFWKSETENYSEFQSLDPQLGRVDMAGIPLDRFTELELIDPDSFYYSYHSNIISESFSLKGHFRLSAEEYESMKNQLQQAETFDLHTREETKNGIPHTVQVFQFDLSVVQKKPLIWENATVVFYDSEQSVRIDLSGKYYT